MQVSWATDEGSPERGNEDFVASAPGAVVILDGCGLPLGTDLGCAHGTAWYSRSLGTRLLARLMDGVGPPGRPPVAQPVGPPEGAHQPGERPLVARLAGAISDVAASHRATCDLGRSSTPAATVVALRVRGDQVDYLVLADSSLLLHRTDGEIQHITGGGTFAAADPDVAEAAITGTVPLAELRHATLLTDGATRPVDSYRLMDWREMADIVVRQGPRALIDRTRETEHGDPQGTRWPRQKIHDDATLAHCTFAP
ncbi:integrase [Actinomadura barringtoniae]|uniref:Integrase n=1 Tax=Actinomadura barringtoniae TaxID=1427535 RepID=A0A939PC82_9ACTN|nr:integrase [Actinomadura barringtoniae]MBO2449728.1 integrase [Actinomadura barringtoniae]